MHVVKTVPLDTLKPHPRNPRRHSASAIAKLAAAIKEYGFTQPILVSADGYILAGHTRLKAAKEAGLSEVPVIELPLSGDKAIAYMIADNRLQDETDWAFSELADLLLDLDASNFDLSLTAFDSEEIEKMMHWTPADIPTPKQQKDPELPGECFVEISCSREDLEQFKPILAEWGNRDGCTVNVSA